MHNFDFVKPSSIAEAVQALSAEGAQALSGGQTLIPTMKQRLAAPAVLVSLTGIKEMQGVCTGDGGLHIGAATPHAVVAREAARHYPALAKLAGGIGDPQVRARGTMGGSVANNDPAADYPAAVLACRAQIVTDRRTIEADTFFQGMFTTALGPDELITAIRFAIPKQAAYEKFAQAASGYAMTGVFVARFDDGVRVAVTGAGPCVFRWAEAEAALSRRFAPDAVASIRLPADGLNTDQHAPAAYRANLAHVMLTRSLERLCA